MSAILDTPEVQRLLAERAGNQKALDDEIARLRAQTSNPAALERAIAQATRRHRELVEEDFARFRAAAPDKARADKTIAILRPLVLVPGAGRGRPS